MSFYSPLRSTDNTAEIRLCSLLPGSFEATIKCRIESLNLNNAPAFEALSYTWGDASDCIPIEVNSETVLVTVNLSTALTYLRKFSDSRYLWVDAICINQNDADERSKQVALMWDIYRTASRVISWLGVRDSLFDPFVEMEHAALLFQHIRFLKKHQPFQLYIESGGAQRPYPSFEGHKSTFNDGLYSLQLLIGEREREKPAYWQRAWIIQEVAAATTWMLQSGPYVISEEEIDSVTEFISCPRVALLMDGRYEQRKFRSRLQADIFLPMSIYRSLLYPSQEDKEMRAARIRGPLRLLNLLRHNRSRLCSDMRDKVYSILGLSDFINLNHSGISIDYKRSVSEVYTGTVQAIIESSASLDALCSANLAETAAMPGLPSWVPNWGTYKSPDTCEKPVSYKHHAATRNMPATFRFWSDGTNQILSVIGFCFGSILNLKDPFVKFDIDSENNEELSRLLNYASLFRQISQAYKDMAKFLHPRALSADLFRHTCSLGLLRLELDDNFETLMEEVNLGDNADLDVEVFKFSKNRFRLKRMASSVNAQCMFAIQQHPLRQSMDFADGTIGIAPPGVVQKGDLVCLLFGCNAPIILRPVGNRYSVVCAAYVDNLMDGSAMAFLEDGLYRSTVFDLQ